MSSIVIGGLMASMAAIAFAKAPVYFGGDIAGFYRQRPTYIHITSDQNIRQISWNSWGGQTASGHGTVHFSVADNLPPAAVHLKLSTIKNCGNRRQYLSLRVSYVYGKPPYAPQSYVNRYTCRSPF